VASGLEFLVGFAMFGAIIFLPLYLQTVGGASAENSGVLILPLMAGLMFSSIYSGRLITKTGRYKIFPIVGTATIAVGLYLLSTMGVGTSRLQSSLYMVVLGLGMGMIIQVMVLAVQNAVPHADLGTATATESFTRSMGGAFGVAVFGAILTNRLTHNLEVLVPASARANVDVGALTAGSSTLDKLPPAVRDGVIQSLANAIHVVFLWAIPLAVAAFGVTWLLRELPLREHAHIGGAIEEAGEELLVGFGQIEPDSAPDLVEDAPTA
jgi:MFS family permease